jgi:LEA14-like dessication related protein
MKKLLTSFLVTLAAITLFSGCSANIKRLGIEAHLTKLSRQTDGSIVATLAFSNPNVGSVNIAASSHEVSLNGRSVGTLNITEPLGIPAQQLGTLTAVLKPSANASVSAGSHSYQLKSLLIFNLLDDDTEKFRTQSTGTVVVE